MLSLTRRKNQSIIITLPNSEKIIVHVSKLSTNQCRLNFDLPSKNYIVDRLEIHEYHEQKRQVEKSNVKDLAET